MPSRPNPNTDAGKLRLAIIDIIGEEDYQKSKVKALSKGANWQRVTCSSRYMSEAEAYSVVIQAKRKFGLDVTYDIKVDDIGSSTVWVFRIRNLNRGRNHNAG